MHADDRRIAGEERVEFVTRCCDRFSSWGTVWINTYGYTDVRLPSGGARDSGFGREDGDAAIENFTEPKAVWMNLSA